MSVRSELLLNKGIHSALSRVLLSLLLLSFVVCAQGCGAASSQRAADGFVIGLESAPETLDPRLATDAYAVKLCELIYAGLFRMDEQLQLIPHLAQSYRQLSPTRYEFTLRPQLTFHNGQPLTTKDVVWTYESVRQGRVRSPHVSSFSKIKNITVRDEHTFEIELKEPFAPFLLSLTLGILPATADNATTLSGAGPYLLKRFVPQERVELEAFPAYFAGAPHARTLTFEIFREDNLRLLALVQGRVDLLQNNVPAALIPYVKKHAELRLQHSPGINFNYLGFNLQDPLLAKHEVRQAIAQAIDIPSVIRYKLQGLAQPADSLLAPLHWAYAPAPAPYAYDPEAARRLLDAAGFVDPDGEGPKARFSLTFKTSSKRDRIGLARLYAAYLAHVGIELKILAYEWGTLFRDIRQGNFQLYGLTWVGVVEPDIYYYAFHTSQWPPVGVNRNRYSNAQIDQWTELARHEPDQAARRAIYRKVQETLARDLPYVNLWYEDNVVVTRNNVHGYQASPNASFWGLQNLSRADSSP